MCGIAGIVDYDRHESYEPLLLDMIGLIRHRGPDSFGLYEDDLAGLISTRLSIIDLAGGDQPISNEDGSVWIVYNGEIYNYPEIRDELAAAGHIFSTRTDTEILVHLYEEHGTDFCNRLNGQFAFALWDRRKKSLLLGRDRLGVRPLFYAQSGENLFSDRRSRPSSRTGGYRGFSIRSRSPIFSHAGRPWGIKPPFRGSVRFPRPTA